MTFSIVQIRILGTLYPFSEVDHSSIFQYFKNLLAVP